MRLNEAVGHSDAVSTVGSRRAGALWKASVVLIHKPYPRGRMENHPSLSLDPFPLPVCVPVCVCVHNHTSVSAVLHFIF